jgi:hypothetical protein
VIGRDHPPRAAPLWLPRDGTQRRLGAEGPLLLSSIVGCPLLVLLLEFLAALLPVLSVQDLEALGRRDVRFESKELASGGSNRSWTSSERPAAEAACPWAEGEGIQREAAFGSIGSRRPLAPAAAPDASPILRGPTGGRGGGLDA